MFRIGNHTFDELLLGTAFNIATGAPEWVADQFRTASIEISSDSTDITDRNGTTVMTRYAAKSGTFNSTHAFLHPVIMNAQSGSAIQIAEPAQVNPDTGEETVAAKLLKMPKMMTVAAGTKNLNVSDAILGTITVIGLFSNGANDVALTAANSAVAHVSFKLVTETVEEVVKPVSIDVPDAGDDAPIQYVVCYERNKDSGIILTNSANTFSKAVNFKLLCSYVDICTKETKPAIVELPSFTPDPNMTITFDREEQDIDFNGTLGIDFCSTDKTLYRIYYPDEQLVVTGAAA